MTKREFLNAVAANETLATELREFATAELEKIEATNARRAEKRKNTPSKTAIENQVIFAQIRDLLATNGGFMTADEIAPLVEQTPNKVTAICSRAAKEGKLLVERVKSTAKSGGKKNAYAVNSVSSVPMEVTAC